TLRYGGTGADLTQGSTTTSQVGWVELVSNGDPFGTPPPATLLAAQGAIAFAGEVAVLVRGHPLMAGQSGFTVAGQDVNLTSAGNPELAAANGALVLGGQQAILKVGRLIAVAGAQLVFTGETA